MMNRRLLRPCGQVNTATATCGACREHHEKEKKFLPFSSMRKLGAQEKGAASPSKRSSSAHTSKKEILPHTRTPLFDLPHSSLGFSVLKIQFVTAPTLERSIVLYDISFTSSRRSPRLNQTGFVSPLVVMIVTVVKEFLQFSTEKFQAWTI